MSGGAMRAGGVKVPVKLIVFSVIATPTTWQSVDLDHGDGIYDACRA